MRMTPLLRFGPVFAALTLCAASANADTIYLLDGKSKTGVDVKSENLKEITYKDGSKSATVKTDDVLRIEFSSKSALVDRADAAAADGQAFDAIGDLLTFVDGLISSKKEPHHKWELAYAMYRLVELNGVVGDAPGLISAADKLIANAPESRYLPMAFLAKAEAQHANGESAAAQKTLKDFLAVIQANSLSQRWQIEHKLATAIFDGSLKGVQLRETLDKISDQAGTQFPQVRNRAEVAFAESLLESKKFDEAEPIFTSVTADAKAELKTLAAAYTGLGDCLFKRGAESKDEAKRLELLTAAAKAYMRVVVVYKDQTVYVPKAMFWCGRVFGELGGDENKERSQKLYRKVMIEYRGSKWADEANAFRKR